MHDILLLDRFAKSRDTRQTIQPPLCTPEHFEIMKKLENGDVDVHIVLEVNELNCIIIKG